MSTAPSRPRIVTLSVMLAACARELPSSAGQGGAVTMSVSMVGVGCSDAERTAPARQVMRGLATYYHDSLEGNATASGEPYDPERWSAAHRSLPFGTRLRVSRTDITPSPLVCVVVNDRGPFGSRRRVLDVSRRAAEQLQMIRAGVVPVRIDVL